MQLLIAKKSTPVNINLNCTNAREDSEETNNSIATDTFTVYPNPANDHVNIVFSSDKEESFTICLMDITGRIALSQINNSIIGINQYQTDLSTIAKGVYVVILQIGEVVKQIKIVVE